MLKTRNLDDQTYASIVTAAQRRLPWLCPRWTDHNATDPGITILELMAWYKELQQYQMNQVTDALKLKLLKLAGAVPRPASPARCAVEIGDGAPARPIRERLHTREGIPFELAEPVPAARPVLSQVRVCGGERQMDVGGMLRERPVTFHPFELGGRPARLRLGFSRTGEGALRLWFDVERPDGAARNPFEDDRQVPRLIRWTCEGAAGTELAGDGTHALSASGYVTVRPQGDWPAGEDGLYWLTAELEDAGCEESVRLFGVSSGRFEAVQQETWASTRLFRADSRPDWCAQLPDAQARDGQLAVFLRTGQGWEQTDRWRTQADLLGRRIYVDTGAAAQDGGGNVMLLCLDPRRAGELLFDAKGLPGETFFLRLDGLTVLSEQFSFLCNTLYRDGRVRPALWRCVDDLYQYGPRDRVFTYDPARETVTFGDGEHGALLQGGPGAVLAAELVVSRCAGGNIPGGRNLAFDDGVPLHNTAAGGGVDREGLDELQVRLLRELDETKKCVCAQDYERLARLTPGLRVAAAKAIPAYDADEPTGVSRTPTVTVVVVPDGAGDRPMPDGRFLEAVQRQMDAWRPIGTVVKVVPPVYVGIDVAVSLRGGEDSVEQAVERALRDWLSLGRAGIGGTLRAGDVSAIVQAAPGVLRVRRAAARAAGPGCSQSADGDIRLPRQGIPYLRRLTVEKQGI